MTKLDYDKFAKILKAMADPKRLKIVDILSCGTMCGCEILANFDFTQPTLSHHMKVLQDAGIVVAEKVGKWQHYSLNSDFVKLLPKLTYNLLKSDENCICHQTMQKEAKIS